MRAREAVPWCRTIIATPAAGPSTGLPARSGDGRLKLGGDRLGGLHVRARERHEDRTPVVLQLSDALPDVGERAVGEALRRLAEIHPRIPPAAQLLDRGDVDHP